MNTRIIKSTICLAVCLFARALQAGIDYGSTVKGDEPELCVDRFGIGQTTVISNGYLFIEFVYMPPPYRIQRIGQAIAVNGIMVNRPFSGEPPTGSGVKKYGYTEDNIKSALSLYERLLLTPLQRGVEAVFLCQEGYEKRRYPSMKESGRILKIPIFDILRTDVFVRLAENVLTNQSVESSGEMGKIKKCFRWFNDEDVSLFIRNVRKCPQLAERIRNEIAEANAPQPNKIPPYAKLASELTVVSMSAHEFKLDVVFEDGLAPSLNDDWEIEDILFETNVTRVVACRVGHPPLPKTRSIRSLSRRTATIISLRTGESCTSTITDKPERLIHLDGIKYQVLDIRFESLSVLLKNCATGEKLLVVRQPESPKKGSQ